MKELDRLAAETLARPTDRPAIEYEKRWITWGDMRRVAERVGDLLDASGAGSRVKVAVVARNQPSVLAAVLGLLVGRHSIRMVYPFQSSTAMARDLIDIAPAAVVAAEEDLSDDLLEALKVQGMAAIALREMDAYAPPGLERSLHTSGTAEEPRIEILTSGTTGKPKPFALDYDTIARHIVSVDVAPSKESGTPEQQPPMLMYFPIGNISGLYSTLPSLLSGRRAVLLDRFSVEGWHDYILRFRPTISGLPPAGVQMVLDANLPPEDLASLKMLGAGAAPLDPEVQRAFEQRYGIPILLSYGATEFAGPVTRMTPELYAKWGDKKLGSVGKALPGAKLRVVDPDSGAELPPGEEGILEVVSPRIGPAWIRTSDLAVIDEDGFLWHRGRADGAIMRGGFKLLPETIEQALLRHPAVSAAAVVGIDDKRLGQVPAAAVQLRPGSAAVSHAELEAHLREHVPATHIPAAWRIVDELPKTRMSFKIDRPAVRALFETSGVE